MKKRIFQSLALTAALAVAAALLLTLGLVYAFPGISLLPWVWAGAGAALLAVMLILAAALSTRTARRVLRPVEEFAEHPDSPVPDEAAFPELAPSLEKLREGRRSLSARIAQLEEERNVTGIIIGNMQRELERQRESFAADIAQLRAPLASIDGHVERIETIAADGGEIRRLAGLIGRESARMSALADDMLRLSRLDETGAVSMDRVSLTSVCRETLTSLSLVAHRRGVSLKLIGPEVWTRGSAQMLTELMTCLCENAIIYNREGGSVLVETGGGPDAGTVWVAVRDTGIGVPEDAFQRIFERFYRAENSPPDQAGCTGLGLAIAGRLAQFHQGSISLESTLGEGSVFTLTLPAWLENAPLPAEEAALSRS